MLQLRSYLTSPWYSIFSEKRHLRILHEVDPSGWDHIPPVFASVQTCFVYMVMCWSERLTKYLMQLCLAGPPSALKTDPGWGFLRGIVMGRIISAWSWNWSRLPAAAQKSAGDRLGADNVLLARGHRELKITEQLLSLRQCSMIVKQASRHRDFSIWIRGPTLQPRINGPENLFCEIALGTKTLAIVTSGKIKDHSALPPLYIDVGLCQSNK